MKFKFKIALLILSLSLITNISATYAVGPSVRIASITPQNAKFGQEVQFIGEVNQTDYEVVGYNWTSDVDGLLSEELNFNISNLSATNHTITFSAIDSNGQVSTAESWVNVQPVPFSKIISSPSELTFGDVAVFEGYAASPFGDIVEYEWNSSIDGFLSNKQNFTTANLSPGIHTITFRAEDSTGNWSNPVNTTVKVAVKAAIPEIGSPVQIVPVFSTVFNPVFAYNVTPGYPNIYCQVDYGSVEVPCSDLSPKTIHTCKVDVNGYALNSPVLEFYLFDPTYYHFLIYPTPNSEMSVVPTVGVGTINVSILSPVGTGYPISFGNFNDLDFLPYGLKLEISMNENITKNEINGTFYSGAFYRLFKVNNCTLVKSIPLSELPYFGSKKNSFVVFLKPTDCEVDENCTYLGEIFAVDGKKMGGTLFTFNYSRPSGNLIPNAQSIDLGNLSLGEMTYATLYINNTGSIVYSMDVNTSNANLSVKFGANTLPPSVTIPINITFTVPDNTTEGKHVDNVTLIAKSGNYTKLVILPVYYTVLPNRGILSPNISSYYFGNDIRPGLIYNVNLTLTNIGGIEVYEPNITVPSGFTAQLNQSVILPGESATLYVTLEISNETARGNYTKQLFLKWADGNLTLNASYFADVVVPPKAKVTPSTWNLGKIAPGATASQNFTVGLTQGDPENITITINSSNPEILSVNPSKLTLGLGQNQTEVSFTAPSAEGTYNDYLLFNFYDQGKLFQTINVSVPIRVQVDVNALYNSARSRVISAQNKVRDLEAQALQGGRLYKKIKGNLTTAKSYLSNAQQDLDNAQLAISIGNTQRAKTLITQANAELAKFDNAVNSAETVLNAPRKDFTKEFRIIFITVFAVTIVAFVLLSFREGWIPLENYPKLKKAFQKIGLGSLVEKPLPVLPKTRADLYRRQLNLQRRRPSLPSTMARPVRKWSPAEIQKWKEYYRTHPEYARYIRQKYRAYSNRRFR